MRMNPTDFSTILGNETNKQYLKRMIQKKAVAHSLLFTGPEGVGKGLFAYAFAAQMIGQNGASEIQRNKIATGNHPDIHIYHPEGKSGMHSIESLRRLIDEVHLKPYESHCKVFILHDADRMLSYSANALLKTFEEPPLDTVIILLSSVPEQMLQTILSRCRSIYFNPLDCKDIVSLLKRNDPSCDDEILMQYAKIAEGSASRAIQLLENQGNGNRTFILDILAASRFKTYRALTQAVQTISESFDAKKKQIEESFRQEKFKTERANLTAIQQQSLEKELEGVISLRLSHEAGAIFQVIQSWYRDLHLLHVKGDPRLLINPEYAQTLENIALNSPIPSLEEIEKQIKDAKLALQRSTSLSICLENLFLKIRLTPLHHA